ncbi:MAG: multicopper oxidase domain-containing protein [Chloroflexota bacterium]
MAPADLSFTDERADALAEIRATNPNMELKMGPYDYRERLIFAQSVLALRSEDKDAPPQSQQLKSPPKAAVNGSPNPMLIHMRPGAVERWRILNGSVDGRGYKRFMVLEGQLVLDPSNNNQLTAITELGTETTYTPVPLARTPENSIDFEDLKQPLYLLAFDGVTLVASDGDGGWQYAIKDLSNQGSGRANPLTESNTLENPNAAMQERIANCYKDADSIKGAFVRPNEVYLAPANRADLFFQAPTGTLDPFTVTISDPTENLPQSDSAAATQGFIDAFASTDTLIGEEETQITVIQTDRHKNPTEWRIDNPISFEQDSIVAPSETYLLKPGDNKDEFIVTQVQIYTIVAKSSLVAGDNYQSTLQEKAAAGTTTFASPPQDIVLAHIVVSGSSLTDDSEQPLINVMTLNDILPPVPPYHLPIQDAELAITDEEADARSDVTAGNYRTRTVTYSGWGSADYPLITTATPDRTGANFREFVGQDKDHDRNTIGKLENIVYAQPKDKDGKGIVDDEGEPIYVLMPSAIRSMAIDGRKFNPNDTLRPRMLLDSAEEWALYNDSIMLWGNTASQPPGHYGDHHVGYPITRKEGQEAFNRDAELQIVARAIDHPFHIHQNPFWVISVEIPDENGDLHNILEEPRWQDVVWIPRNGGRVVFRSRFPDYVGRYVNHCHILLHEDNGMMTAIEATPYMDQTNYVGRSSVASVADGTPPTSDVINQVYTPPTLEEAYVQSMQFEDNNPHRSQVYPGFDVEPPQ